MKRFVFKVHAPDCCLERLPGMRMSTEDERRCECECNDEAGGLVAVGAFFGGS